MNDKNSKTVGADSIGEFYTNHPYPPPITNLDRARDLWENENAHRAEWHLLWPHQQYRPEFDVLVAGCGTWQSAKFALTHPRARVVAIDVSTTSLEHTDALKQKYDLANLEVRQLPIESAAELDHQFDMIVCTGVLHHLVDPDAGLRALGSVLKPGGAMYLMVYAPYGRAGVYMIREYCRRLGVGASPQEVNDLTTVLRTLPQHHPLISMFRGAREGLDAAALVDALLNPRDRTYSVPQIYDFLENNGLQFGRWYWQAAYSPRCGAVSETAHAPLLRALPEREQYVEMELWRGLMTNHDFVAYGSKATGDAAQVSLAGERYLNYVPIRRTWTVCIQERLPPGAAGVLVNQTHLFNDLFVFIDDHEKSMYEAIDGRRTIGDIAKEAQHARAFFDKLWWYDQVVFDTSNARKARRRRK
ncbi:MAG TPA: class I SAM-dependent methyltransferase [Pyrinomonadaceae bacterium]|nr:class I SAM-dependent methyltransferase [Pyrinomonadaceae bacterium]